jgi:hypothetical protein
MVVLLVQILAVAEVVVHTFLVLVVLVVLES